ncbi:MAG: Crp/Fnr family transcriptional regulator [Puia sp.]|nr:Crp/Fnr family transcriptional regulator [Puia sp.]
MVELVRKFNIIYPLSNGLRQFLFDHIKEKKVAKKDLLLKFNQVCGNIYFVKQGLFRGVYMKDGKEVTSWFMKEGDLVVSVESFFGQVPSYEKIEALEDSEVYYISYIELQHIYRHYTEFNFIGRVLTEQYYALSERRAYSLRMQSATDRYCYMLKHHADLLRRVPAVLIASHLGITAETFSRIKAKIRIGHS